MYRSSLSLYGRPPFWYVLNIVKVMGKKFILTCCSPNTDTYSHAASSLVAGNNLEQTIQQLMDMGGGNWDKETVTRALRAAYNNPERAVDYLYSVCLKLYDCI